MSKLEELILAHSITLPNGKRYIEVKLLLELIKLNEPR